MKNDNLYNFCLFKIPQKGGRLIWEITNKCNYSCKYCIFSSGIYGNHNELETQKILNTLQEIWGFGIRQLKITGGEPFIRKDICEILSQALNIGFEIDISTNASLLNQEHIDTLHHPNIKYVHVSLDGADSHMQAIVRGDNTFSLTVRGIQKLVQSGIYTRIGTVIHKGNEDHLDEIINKVIELGANEIIFSIMEPVGRMKGDSSLVATKNTSFFEKQLNLLKVKYTSKIIINYSFTNTSIDDQSNKKKKCPGGSKFIFLNSKGQLSPCTWISEYFPEFISKQTLKTRSFSELMKSPEMLKYKKFQNDFLQNGMIGCPKVYLNEIVLNQGRITQCPHGVLSSDLKKAKPNPQESSKQLLSDINNEIAELFEGNFDNYIKETKRFSKFSPIYSFTTENIGGYFPRLDFDKTNVLAVTGSGDHIINAFMFGAKYITCFDSNILSRLWAEFKIIAMKNMEYENFLDFFLIDSKSSLDYNLYQGFKTELSETTRLFFDKLYTSFSFNGEKIRKSYLFNNNFDFGENKIKYNPYLRNRSNYLKAQNNLQISNIQFLDLSIQELSSDKDYFRKNKFDIILLSNISDYSHEIYKNMDYLKEFNQNIVLPLEEGLSTKGKLIFAYIYNSGNDKLRNNIDSYELRLNTFGNYRYSEISFSSVINKKQEDKICIQEKRIKHSLIENSVSYYENAGIYDRFSEVEDSELKVFRHLKKNTQNKIVLDIGCGTGKYLKLLAPTIKKGLGVDISSRQISIAMEKCKDNDNIEFMVSTVEKINIPDNSVDIIYGTWCIGSIAEKERREIIISELRRILKKGGKIYLVENDETGEFEELRGKTINPQKPTHQLNNHILEMGFNKFCEIKTNFRFKNLAEAKCVFRSIWGKNVDNKITSNKINHDIVVFEFKK